MNSVSINVEIVEQTAHLSWNDENNTFAWHVVQRFSGISWVDVADVGGATTCDVPAGTGEYRVEARDSFGARESALSASVFV